MQFTYFNLEKRWKQSSTQAILAPAEERVLSGWMETKESHFEPKAALQFS